jgi:hypothetical protein
MAKSGERKGTARPAPQDAPVKMRPARAQLGLIEPLKERKNSRLESARRWLSQPANPGNPLASFLGETGLSDPLKLKVEAEDAFERFADRSGLDLPQRIEILRMLLASHEAQLPRPKVVPLPTTAPEAWSKRDLNLRENPVEYTRRAYARWLGHGLTRKDLKALDPDLYRALSVWVSRHPDDAIAELPAQSEILDDLIDRLSAQLSLDDLRKLGYAIDTRLRRASKK